MFRFLRRTGAQPLTAPMREALLRGGLPPGMDAASLAVVGHRGSYAGRAVHYIRVFDPVRAAEGGVEVDGFRALDAYPDLVLSSGHVEREGAVVLTPGQAVARLPVPERQRADRATHADDEQYVFPSGQNPED